jgi:hypothetical protein
MHVLHTIKSWHGTFYIVQFSSCLIIKVWLPLHRISKCKCIYIYIYYFCCTVHASLRVWALYLEHLSVILIPSCALLIHIPLSYLVQVWSICIHFVFYVYGAHWCSYTLLCDVCWQPGSKILPHIVVHTRFA